jgi:hypothetical protein
MGEKQKSLFSNETESHVCAGNCRGRAPNLQSVLTDVTRLRRGFVEGEKSVMLKCGETSSRRKEIQGKR